MMCLKSDSDSIEKCADYLKSGKILIIPTDTVYGFSGIVEPVGKTVYNTDARIRSIKGRAETKPFIQLLPHPEDIFDHTNDRIPEEIFAVWPGALTVIVHDKDGTGTTAYRCPGDQWIRKIIEKCGFPVYSTSVNRSGSPVLDTIKEIYREFEGECDLIVSDGDKKGALPSTIVSILNGKITVLRQGSVKIQPDITSLSS
jgi:L-threonylcarbamoyladenylate synthase